MEYTTNFSHIALVSNTYVGPTYEYVRTGTLYAGSYQLRRYTYVVVVVIIISVNPISPTFEY